MIGRRGFLMGTAAAAAHAAVAENGQRGPKSGLFMPSGAEFEGMDGAFAALFTPFGKNGELNEAMIEKQVEFMLAHGLKGFYLTGSTGEGLLLTSAERCRVYDRVVKTAAGRAKVIAHVGCVATDDAVALAKQAERAGCDWVSSVAPVYFGNNFEATHHHYQAIASATGLPFMIYSRGAKIEPDVDARYFDIPNVKGMKYTASAYWTVKCLKRRLNKEVVFMAGMDEQELCAFSYGDVFTGCIGSTDNSIPYVHSALCAAVGRGDFASAAVLQDQVVRFVELILEKNNTSWHKSVMKYIGLDCGWCRAPNGKPLTRNELSELFAKLDALGFVKRI
jgi:N-acetylneuraminate lyase